MAGDWLQIDCDLPEKPETQRICDATGLDVPTVCGMLLLFWRWVDCHAVAIVSGSCPVNVRHVSVTSLVRVVGGDDTFWKSLADVGWIVFTKDGVVIPGWEKRFSKSAKSRMLDARRKADKRRKNVRQQPDKKRTTPGPKEEKRRVLNTPISPKGELGFAVPKGTCLDVPEFHAAWLEWQQHRREIKHKLTASTAAKQLEQFVTWGVARSIAAIRHTITKGWQGIQEPTDRAGKPTTDESQIPHWERKKGVVAT